MDMISTVPGLAAAAPELEEMTPFLRGWAKLISGWLHGAQVAVVVNLGGLYRPICGLGYSAMPDVYMLERSAIVQRLQRENRPLASVDMDSRRSARDRAMLQGLRAQFLLPITIKRELLGFITVGPKKAEEPYSNTDLRLLDWVVAVLGNSRVVATFVRQYRLFRVTSALSPMSDTASCPH